MNYLLVFSGALIALLERFVSAYAKQGFKFSKFVQLNIGLFLLNVFVGMSAIIAIYEFNDGFLVKFQNWDATGIFWLMIGAIGHYVYKLVLTFFRKFVTDKFKAKK
jgi:hypothetical protein